MIASPQSLRSLLSPEAGSEAHELHHTDRQHELHSQLVAEMAEPW